MARAQSSLAASAALCSRAMMPFPASSAGTLLSCSARSWPARLGANATTEAGGSRCWTPIAFPRPSDVTVYNEGNARQLFGSRPGEGDYRCGLPSQCGVAVYSPSPGISRQTTCVSAPGLQRGRVSFTCESALPISIEERERISQGLQAFLRVAPPHLIAG